MEFIKHDITGYYIILNEQKLDIGRIYQTSDGWIAELFDASNSCVFRSIADKLDELRNAINKP